MELKTQIREKLGKKVRSLREQGMLPAVLYRKGKENVNLQMDAAGFKKVFDEVGETSAVTLKIEGGNGEVKNKERSALIHDLAHDPLTGEVIHVDFYEVKLDEKTTASVPLVFVGESLAIKTNGGTLIKSMTEVEVEALVRDLPRHIEVDISVLESFDAIIHIKDLKVPGNVKILAEPEEIVALAAAPRKEEEVAPVVEAVEGAEEAKEAVETGAEEKQGQ
jgi:large subunit ribosomal protein L25